MVKDKAFALTVATLIASFLLMVCICARLEVEAEQAKGENRILQARIAELEARPLTIELVREDPAEADKPEYHEEAWQSIGECRITHYCSCAKCCGKSDGITASGAQATVGRTVAVDPDVIPLGSEVLINGQIYIAEDTGAKGSHVDIYVCSHDQALQMGTYRTEVCWR